MDTYTLFEKILQLEISPRRKFIPESTAIAILPGGGGGDASNARLRETPWQRITQKVWVAGTRGDPLYTREDVVMLLWRINKLPRALEFQGFAYATPDQMHWVSERLLEDKLVNMLLLCSSSYHLPRCVLTFIKVWGEYEDGRKLRIKLIPTSDPKGKTLRSSTSQTVHEELKRIEEYQKKGDIATEREFFAFFQENRQTIGRRTH